VRIYFSYFVDLGELRRCFWYGFGLHGIRQIMSELLSLREKEREN
jgi:hypothetical protein